MVVFQGGIEAQAVIFDFDGVIVDTEPLHYKSFQQLLEPLGMGFSWEEYVETYMGFDDRDAFIEAFTSREKQIDPIMLNSLIKSKAVVFQSVIRDGVSAYPGVVNLVNKLHKADIPLGICSGALRSDIIPILQMLKIEDCFEVIVTAEEVSKSKPDPESYILAFKKLADIRPHINLSPATVLAIEDTPAGITSAAKSGLTVLAVTNSYPREQLSSATFIVDSQEQLLEFKVF